MRSFCECGHHATAHMHDRAGTDCSRCECGRLRRRLSLKASAAAFKSGSLKPKRPPATLRVVRWLDRQYRSLKLQTAPVLGVQSPAT